MVITLVYDGHLRSLYILPYNPFVTNSFAGLLELPADLTPLLTLESLGRRWTCFLALTLSGLSSIATGLIHPGSFRLHRSSAVFNSCYNIFRIMRRDNLVGGGGSLFISRLVFFILLRYIGLFD